MNQYLFKKNESKIEENIMLNHIKNLDDKKNSINYQMKIKIILIIFLSKILIWIILNINVDDNA